MNICAHLVWQASCAQAEVTWKTTWPWGQRSRGLALEYCFLEHWFVPSAGPSIDESGIREQRSGCSHNRKNIEKQHDNGQRSWLEAIHCSETCSPHNIRLRFGDGLSISVWILQHHYTISFILDPRARASFWQNLTTIEPSLDSLDGVWLVEDQFDWSISQKRNWSFTFQSILKPWILDASLHLGCFERS